jgi:acyl transferase domain-containing protein/NAD(P)-dependent dehydrogenase (short-subunit alcohol dehydrogenase family)/acyl carrier protein
LLHDPDAVRHFIEDAVMEDTTQRAIAIVGAGAVLPDASNVATFWQNIKAGRNCITEVSPDRWNPEFYFDADHSAPDKTYSKIGGWVREFSWDPMKWRLPIPPRVAEAMDESQKWAIACTREALEDYGYPNRPLDADRTAVILGNAMAGEKHYLTSMRVYFPEYAHQLDDCPAFASLPKSLQADITRELRGRIAKRLPEITEDSMPGELANCLAGRIANLYNFHGPNFTADAACASTMAALSAAVNGLVQRDFDTAVVGGIDRNMGAPTFVKFCKIGALSATGSRPYAEGADGFVMGEGAAIFILKRLAEAERDGDKIYAVLRGIGGSSDGKGKGITAPNPVGQRFAIERAWQNAGVSPATASFMEGHGTSTRVGDVVEVQSMADVLGSFNLPAKSVALGSVKSNIGHLKGAAGAAATLKVALSLRDKVLPPSVNCARTNPDIDFAGSPLYVNTELKHWPAPPDGVRRAGLSAFGFGGTNFHMVLEEYIPQHLSGNGKRSVSVAELSGVAHEATNRAANKVGAADASANASVNTSVPRKAPLRGALVIGADSAAAIAERLRPIQQAATAGQAPPLAAPAEAELLAPERLSIDYRDAAELAEKATKALKALAANQPAVWTILRAQGIFRGHGPAPKVAFLYTGQGSQYVNMVQALRAAEPIVAETFAEADRVLTPLISKPLSEFIFIDGADEKAVAQAEDDLRQTAITQPAVIATDVAITRLLAAYGIQPDMAMGHSVGEYGALVASGALPFEDAMEAVSARGREMTHVALGDNGGMVAVFAPLEQIEQTLKSIDGYVVIANVNSKSQAVIGGESKAIQSATEAFLKAGFNAMPLPVSHAFHTAIVAGASEPLKRMLERLRLQAPRLPIIANLNGEFYPTGADAKQQMVEMLAKQVASPVQFVKGLETLYAAGARVFVETGPKKALQGFAEDVLREHGDVVSLFTNHPKLGDVVAFNQALCGLYAAGLGAEQARATCEAEAKAEASQSDLPVCAAAEPTAELEKSSDAAAASKESSPPASTVGEARTDQEHFAHSRASSIVITGAALGLPGTERIFDDSNIGRILDGERFIDAIPAHVRHAMLDKHITRLVKNENGGAFETIDSVEDVIKLAGRGGAFDLESEFGVSADRAAALDRVTSLAIASGIDALRDAGIPLVMRYKTTTIGTQLADRWMLPEALRDDTGVICASAFPGYNYFAEELSRYHEDRMRRAQLAMLGSLKIKASEVNGHSALGEEIAHRFEELQIAVEKNPYMFDRRFLFKALSMGHSQLAEFIGARGPNTQINAACASTPQAVSLAEDWIHAGRCRRVIVISADDVTSDHLLEWIGAGFLASGAAATDEVVEDAAIPFDRRRHGMIVGMGAGALVVESADAVRERGIQPICEVLSTVTANSAFHGTRLDVTHIGKLMEELIAQAETRKGISRSEIAPKTVFVSHETYTPARGGSAAAEIHALRHVFGDHADQIVIANTKGFTGHAMATGIEDVVAVKALETGCVPPVANFKEVDPELGPLNLSKGGTYPVEYALRLAAGFGSQISMTLLRWVATKDSVHPAHNALGYTYRIADADAWKTWLGTVSGNPSPTLEIVHRTLRICDARAPRALAAVATSQPASAPTVPAAHTQEPRTIEATGPILKPQPAMASASASHIATTAQAPMAPVIPKPEPAVANVIPASSKPATPVAMPRPATTVPPEPSGLIKEEEMDAIKEKVLDIVAEKTGYPKDMLDLDLDLEADLGVDTVKQAEMFAAVRAAYNIPRDENVKLRDFPTLAHVIRFAHDRSVQASAPAEATPAAPVAVAAPTPAPVPPAAVSDESIKEKVLDIVAEKTGYPKDMLDLDLDLEADLGVDTVKQAEMFAAVRAAYNIPRDENVKLRDFPTLAHVIRFAHDRVLQAHAPAEKAPAPETPAAPQPAPLQVARPRPALASLDATNSIPRRVPTPILRPALTVCKPTGVKLGAGSRVVLMPDKGGVADALTKHLQSLGVEVLRIEGAPDADALIATLKSWVAMGPIQGVYWLAALDHGTSIRLMDLPGWREALRVRVKLLYTTMRALYEQIAAPGTFLVSATLLGGQHGYDEAGAVAPLGGPVVGMTKTYKRERAEVLAKAIDFELGCEPAEIADALIDETLRDPGAVEIGYKEGERWTIGLQEQCAVDGQPGLAMDPSNVFVVTGAAGGIVSAITADLAAASGGTFYLLDLVPEPNPDNPDLARFATDKDGLKRELFGRIQARGERATPALVEKELAALERAQAALNAINAVRDAGGTAHYISVNLTDAEGVSKVIEQIRQRSGRIDVLLHAAGMERSHFLPDKDPREFDLIFDVKCDGWFNLLHAIGDMPLGATVAFSSIAGRFGNGGQADYSSANDLLCKITSSFRTTRPSTRGIAIDWTAWGGIGMATRGSIPKMMELAGIDMLPPEAGVPLIRRELTAGGTRGEIVVAQRLGIMLQEWDATGGLDLAAVGAANGKLARGPMIGNVISMGIHSGLTIETTLDPSLQPFLHDHQIGGTPVLPGVMGIEAFAEAAQVMLPGWHVETVEGISFLAPFKFYRNEPRTLTIKATISQEGDAVVADCRLIGIRTLPMKPEPEETVHFTAKVRLTRQLSEEFAVKRFPAANGSSFKAADIYRIYFHGPAYRVLNRAWQDGNCIVGELAKDLPNHHHPSGSPTLLAPRLIELCFQTAGLWEIDKESRMGLPRHVGRVNWRRNPELASGSLFAVVTPHPEQNSFDAEVVDAKGNLYLEVCGYTTVALPDSIDGDLLLALRANEHSLSAAD